MPVILQRNFDQDGAFGIWETSEPFEQLLSQNTHDHSDIETVSSFQHEQRKVQWLAVRCLLHELIPGERIRYDEHGKPWPKNSNCFISVSHSGPLVAVYVCATACGIDIERIRPKIERIAPRFLNEKELADAKNPPAVERMHAYWCAKEAAYKMNGKRNVSLRENIHVYPFPDPGKGETRVEVISANERLSANASFERFRDFMIAWTCTNRK